MRQAFVGLAIGLAAGAAIGFALGAATRGDASSPLDGARVPAAAVRSGNGAPRAVTALPEGASKQPRERRARTRVTPPRRTSDAAPRPTTERSEDASSARARDRDEAEEALRELAAARRADAPLEAGDVHHAGTLAAGEPPPEIDVSPVFGEPEAARRGLRARRGLLDPPSADASARRLAIEGISYGAAYFVDAIPQAEAVALLRRVARGDPSFWVRAAAQDAADTLSQ